VSTATSIRTASILPNTVPISSQVLTRADRSCDQLSRGKEVVITYFGDGGTSEGDFRRPELAAVFNTPVIFFCNNNQWRFRSRSRQTKAKTIARSHRFEIPAFRWTATICWRFIARRRGG